MFFRWVGGWASRRGNARQGAAGHHAAGPRGSDPQAHLQRGADDGARGGLGVGAALAARDGHVLVLPGVPCARARACRSSACARCATLRTRDCVQPNGPALAWGAGLQPPGPAAASSRRLHPPPPPRCVWCGRNRLTCSTRLFPAITPSSALDLTDRCRSPSSADAVWLLSATRPTTSKAGCSERCEYRTRLHHNRRAAPGFQHAHPILPLHPARSICTIPCARSSPAQFQHPCVG